jgi:hypothetical protein
MTPQSALLQWEPYLDLEIELRPAAEDSDVVNPNMNRLHDDE